VLAPYFPGAAPRRPPNRRRPPDGRHQGSYDQNAEPATSRRSRPPTIAPRSSKARSRISRRRTNKGRCLKLTWQVETGAYDGRLFWQRLNMWPENMGPNMDKVITIANSQFASIRQATGKLAPQDSFRAASHPLRNLCRPVQADAGFNQQNEVKSVKAIGGAAGSALPCATAAAAGAGSDAAARRAGDERVEGLRPGASPHELAAGRSLASKPNRPALHRQPIFQH
jgi:hypothetical protein